MAIVRPWFAVLHVFPTPSCILLKLKHGWNRLEHGDKTYNTFCLWKHHVYRYITAKLSIRKPGSSSVFYILLALMKIRAYGSKALQ